MSKKLLRKKLARVTFFSKVTLAMAGSFFLQSLPASAGNPDVSGGRGAAFREFKLSNEGLSNKEINSLFKVHWSETRNAARAVAQPVFEQNSINVSRGQNAVNANLNANLSNLSNQSSLNKHELKLERQSIKQELREAKQNFNQSVQHISADRMIRVNGGFSLDLSSAVENITLGDKLFQNEGSITIAVGGETKTLSAGSKVTAAEYVAAKQVLATGGQKVGLDSSGRAVGGSIDLAELTPGDKTMRVRDFVVPENVSAAGDFGKHGDIRITGDLINSGTIQAFSSDTKLTTATIAADSITNNANASITSEFNQAVRGLGGVVSNLGLNLRADDVLSNFGSITSSGDLTLSAGKTLNNTGSSIAQNNLNLQAPKVFNSGRVESLAANVNLDSSSALLVNNAGGTIAALNGAINVRSAEYQDQFNALVSGGDLLSKELNIFTGVGTANVFVNELTGTVNSSGSAAHVSANTENLILGTQCLVGDPTYYNTGNIILGGDIVVNETLAIIAGGSISTNQSSLLINSQGHDIYMIAGANVQAGSGEVGSGALPPQVGAPSNNANLPVSFSGQSASGGTIDLTTAGANLDILSGGANVLMAAYGGAVRTHLGANINASGSGTANNGNITVIGSTGVTIGNLNSYSGSGTAPGTGNISVYAAQPVFSSGSSITFDTEGSIISGNQIIASNAVTPTGAVEICNARYSGDLTVKAGGDVIMPTFHIPSSRSNIFVSSLNGDVYTNGGSLAKSYLITAGGNIWIRDKFIAPGGIVMIAGRDIATYSSGFPEFDASNASGNGGNITLVAGANYSPGGFQNILGPSASGGSILLNQVVNMLQKFDNHGGGVNSSAGEINLIAYGGSVRVYPTAGDILNFGSGNGSSGKVTVVSQGLTLRGVDQRGTAGGQVGIYNQSLDSPFSVVTNSGSSSFGTLTSFTPSGTLSSANVQVGIMKGSQNLQIRTGGDLYVGGINSDSVSGAVINISLNSALAFMIGGGYSSNGVENGISSNAPAVGNGASLSITNSGTGGIVVANAPAMSVTDGNGITLRLNAGSGLLDIASLGNSINANGTGPGKAAGTIELSYGSLIRTTGNLSLTANSTGSGAGGKVILHDQSSGGLVIGNGNGEFFVSARGFNYGSVIDIATGGSLTLKPTSPLNAETVLLTSGVGGMTISAVANDVDYFTANSTGTISITQDLNFTARMNFVTPYMSLNGFDITCLNLNISSQAGGSLTLDGGVSESRLSTDEWPGGIIRVFSDTGNLTLVGNTKYFTTVYLVASEAGQSIVASEGSISSSLSQGYLLTSSVSGSGSLVTLGTTWIITNVGTYANSQGDVVLAGDLNFSGADLSIIASRNIDLTGATITLDGPTNGGNLTLLAGYNFEPPTSGQVIDHQSEFRNFTPNPLGGSILGGANISTVGGTGRGGDVNAAAYGGTITLGNITVTGGSNTGGVYICATDGVDLSSGTITLNGRGLAEGHVTIAVTKVGLMYGFNVQGGVAYGGLSPASSDSPGNIKLGSIIGGTGSISLFGGFNAEDTITATGALTGRNLNISLNTGNATLNNTSFSHLSVGGNGTVTVTNNRSLQFAQFAGLSTVNLDNGMNSVVLSNGSVASLTVKGSDVTVSDSLFVYDVANLTSMNGGLIKGTLNMGTNGSLTLNSSGTVGVSSSTRFVSNARTVSLSSVGSAFFSSTNSAGLSLGTSTVGGTFDLLSSKSISSSGVVTTNDLKATVTTGGIGTNLAPLQLAGNGNPVSLALSVGSSDAFVNYQDVGVLTLKTSTAKAFTLNAANASVATGGNSTFSGDVNITTSHFINNNTLAASAGDLNIQSAVASGLTLDGGTGGTLTASNGSINITATNGDLILNGKTTYTTTANLRVQDHAFGVVLGAGSESIALVSSVIYSGALSGSGLLTTISPQPNPTWTLVNLVNQSTIANSSGVVVLSGNLTFDNLAIISSGNIDLTGATIDLHGDSGGHLVLIAGYTFEPGTSGTEFDRTTVFNNFTPSAGGSILGNADIDTSGLIGNGGSVLAIAHNGVINLGSITTTGGVNGSGGAVRLIGENGIEVGVITTTGGISSGHIDLWVADAAIPTGSAFEIAGGRIVTGAGWPFAGNISAGDLSFDGISAGDATVTLRGGLNAQNTLELSALGSLAADTLIVQNISGRARVLNGNVNSLEIIGAGGDVTFFNGENDLQISRANALAVKLEVVVGSSSTISSSASLAGAEFNLIAGNFNLTGSVGANVLGLHSSNDLTNANTGILNVANLTMTTSGSIGSSNAPFALNDSVQSFDGTAMGDVFVESLRTTGFTLGSALRESSAGGTFDYRGSGLTNLVGTIRTGNGDINITTLSNRLNVTTNAQILANGTTAGNGDITIAILDTSRNAKKTSVITLAPLSQLRTNATGTDGLITLSVGPVTAPVLGKAPKKNVNLFYNGGTIFWGKKTAAFNAPTSSLTAKGANILFNNAYGNKNIIVSGATLYADPPVADGTPVSIITESFSGRSSGLEENVVFPLSLNSQSESNFGLGLHSIVSVEKLHPAERFDLSMRSGALLANSNLPLATDSNSTMRAREVRQLAYGSSFDGDNSYMVGNAEFGGDFIAGLCTDAEMGFAGDGVIQKVQHSKNVKLSDGSVLFAPLLDTQVETPKGTVRVAANSIALISVSDAGLSVFDLDDHHRGSVNVDAHGHNIVLSPGRHVMITPHHKHEFAQLNPIEAIAHRGLSSIVKNGYRAHMSEFSVVSALDTVRPLKMLVASRHPNARRLAGRMMKTTAILMQIGGSSGQYQHYFRPRMTAMEK